MAKILGLLLEHPIEILKKEHELILGFSDRLKELAEKIQSLSDFKTAESLIQELQAIAEKFKESASHYMREENVLFPTLDKIGIKEPPKIMWMEHDHIREIEKNLYLLIENRESMPIRRFSEQLRENVLSLHEMLVMHFHKENNILFAMAEKVISPDDMAAIKKQFDEMGYCRFTPVSSSKGGGEVKEMESSIFHEGEMIGFETGTVSYKQLDAIIKTLPVEITFIDEQDIVRYFSVPKDPVFARTKAILGLKVQNCHPQKSLHLVNQIIKEFKTGKRDVAEFYIPFNNKFVHIRYFAVRDRANNYLGCMEVTQDIAEIKKLEGEKRLL